MRRYALLARSLPLLACLALLPGCGGGDEVGAINVSPEAEAADTTGQDAMQEYMNSGQAPQP